MEFKDILLKFYKTNSKMIKFIMAQDYYSDEMKLKRVAYFRDCNAMLIVDIKKEIINNGNH